MAQLWGQVSRQPRCQARWSLLAGGGWHGLRCLAAVTEPHQRQKEANAGGRKLGKVREVNAQSLSRMQSLELGCSLFKRTPGGTMDFPDGEA